jgi:hypothetical protein
MEKMQAWIEKISPYSGKKNTMLLEFYPADMAKWQSGIPIQNAMPYLNPEQREYLMTGYTSEDWAAIFGDDEDV